MQLIHCVTILYIFGISTILLGWKRFLLPQPKCMLISLNVFECELYKTIQVHRIKCCMNICEKGGIWLVVAYCRNSSSLSALFHWSQKHKSKTLPDLTWFISPSRLPPAALDSTASLYVRLNSRDFINFPKMKVRWSFNTLEQMCITNAQIRGARTKVLGINIKTTTTPIEDLDVSENQT